jgi:Zn-dependent alcohol dehydrogenase
VVTIGTGGVGLNCVQGAQIANARINVAVDIVAEKLEAARCFGATHVVSPGDEDTEAVIGELTAGRGADYVFVAVGSAAAIEQGVRLVRRGGMVVLVGMTTEGVKASFETLHLANDAIHLVGSKMGASQLKVDVPPLLDHYLAGRLKLRELISGRYPLDGINDAIHAVKAGVALRNVIIFREQFTR